MSVTINAANVANLIQVTLMVVGLTLAWRYQFAASTARWRHPRLQTWNVSGFGLLVIAFQAILGGIVGLSIGGAVNSLLPSGIATNTAITLMVANSGFHLGIIAGIVFGWRAPEPNEDPESRLADLEESALETAVESQTFPPLSHWGAAKFGCITYLAALPVVTLTSLIWQRGLDLLGIPRPKQELIDLFGRAHGFWSVSFLVVMAVIIAPVTEEVVFRAGIFRHLRTRLPRVLAFSLPAALFAAAHTNLSASVPLFVLALILSLAYERSGHVITSIVAHGLFNLTSVILLLAGLDN